MILKRVGVLSAAKISGVMYAAIGLLIGLVMAAVFSLIPMAARTDETALPGWLGTMFGVGSVVFMPIFYGVLGFVMGAVGALIYNLFAGMVGGIEVTLEPGPERH
jgi:hypothetical protein